MPRSALLQRLRVGRRVRWQLAYEPRNRRAMPQMADTTNKTTMLQGNPKRNSKINNHPLLGAVGGSNSEIRGSSVPPQTRQGVAMPTVLSNVFPHFWQMSRALTVAT